MSGEPLRALGAFLGAREAEALAAHLAAGTHVTKALVEVGQARRSEARTLLENAGIDHKNGEDSARILRAIAGAKSVTRSLTPVWTMPDIAASSGRLTNQFHTIVAAAKQSVTCATYNFASTSQMWAALREASERPGVAVTLYLDAAVADVDAVRTQIPHAAVYRPTNSAAGRPIRSHAKFVIIDRRLTFLTSANFSYSAENLNVEFGLLIDDAALAESIEREMREHHSTLYERVEG